MTLFLRTKPADHAADTALPSPWSAAAARRWGRKHLTKDKVINALKTAAWVFPLTILIWIYAEQEQAAEEPTVQALISLQASDPNRVVTLANATDESILVDLKGRRAKVEAVKGELAKNGPEGRVPITIPSSYPPGQIQLPIKQAVQDAPIFVSNGVNVQNVHPATISIIIDRYDTIEVPVLPPPDAKDVGTATFEPKTVRIHGPSKLLKAAKENGQAVAYADFSVVPEFSRPGSHGPAMLPITSPLTRSDHVMLLTPNVTATVTVQQTSRQLVIPSMPVWLEAAESVRKEYTVPETDLTVKDVTVSGPADRIAEINNQTYIPHATLTIRREDAAAGMVRQRLRFDNGSLPAGVTVSKTDQERVYEFRIVKNGISP